MPNIVGGIGHNSQSSGIDTVADLPEGMPKMHFFRCDIAALRKAIIDKPLDIRGAYISVLIAMYEHMEPLPADDAQARLRTGITDARLYRRIKADLIRLGLVFERPSGRISNTRFEEEITAYITEFNNRRKAARDREERQRLDRQKKAIEHLSKPQLSSSYGLAKPQLSSSYALANGQLPDSEAKKSNKNNDRNTRAVAEVDHNGGDTRARTRDIVIGDSIDSESLPQTHNLVSTLSEIEISDDVQKKKKQIQYSEQFETFWRGYPDKTNNSKAMAWTAWQRLVVEDRDKAVRSLAGYTRYCRDHPDYRPLHAERYLRQRRFDAYVEPVAILETSKPAWWQKADVVNRITPERWRSAIAEHANGLWPVDKLGPPPGDARCVVPPSIVSELRLTELYDPSGIARAK